MSLQGGDLVALVTGGALEVLGSGTPPDAPVITAATDDGDQDAITVAVTGTGTIQLYYRLMMASTWTTGETRNGSGDISQAGLTANKWYGLYATDTVDSYTSGPSNLKTVFVAADAATEIEALIQTILTGDATVAALVGTRISPNIIRQGTAMPAVTYQQISGQRDHTLDGASGFVEGRFQVNCWAKTYAETRELADAVRDALDDYSTGTIQAIHLEDEGDIPTLMGGVDKIRRYGKRLDFTVWFDE